MHKPATSLIASSLIISAGSIFGFAKPAAALPYLLVVYASGGWDQSLVFDDKRADSKVSAESGQLAGSVGNLTFVDHPTRDKVKTFFTQYGDHAAIINGLYGGTMDAQSAAKAVLGTLPPGKNRRVDWATLYAQNAGFAGDLPHVVIDAPFMPGEYEDVTAHLTSTTLADYLSKATIGGDLGSSGETALTALRANAYAELRKKAAGNSLDNEKLNALVGSYEREAKLSTALMKAAATVGASGSDDTFLHNAKLAIELFAQGDSLAATVQAGATNLWDTTTNNISVQTQNYQALFGDLTAILTYAASRGVHDQLVMVVVSERGRTPKLNSSAGKGPWPYTSMLVWGSSAIASGRTIGQTDDHLRGIAIDPIFGGTGTKTAVRLQPAHVWSALFLKAGFTVKKVIGDVPPLAQLIN